MSLDNEDRNLLDQPTNHGLQKDRKLKIAYPREFLLSLSELDVCKELPSDFDRSLLSEFEDSSLDRQRSTGSLSSHSFRRNEYSSSPTTRGDTNSFLRGTHGKLETRSLGWSDRDSDSQSSDSGKHSGNQSRRPWQGHERDPNGLLGSASLPKSTGCAPGLSASNTRANGHYQLNRSNEPYQLSRPYKAPHSRRDNRDNCNDETFGSWEGASEDRVEEERNRRASFELMRKQQQKVFQEKQNLDPDKNKDDFDLKSLVDDDEKRLANRNDESVEAPVTLSSLSNDSEKSSFAHIPSAARPPVPPGFASATLERNFGAKTSTNTNVTEVGQSEPRVARVTHINKEEKLSSKQDDDELHYQSTSLRVPNNNDKENILSLSSAVNILDINIGIDNQLIKQSALSETLEPSDNSEFIQLKAEVIGNTAKGTLNQDNSHSILNKLFVNALSINSTRSNSTSVVEPDHKADEAWSPRLQSSKFSHWFVEEEKKPVNDSTHRPNELLSLIVGREKGGSQVPHLETTPHVAPASFYQNAESTAKHMTSNVAHTTVYNSEQLYNSDKASFVPTVLTCEDLEQSILSQVSENGLSPQQPMQGEDFFVETKQSNSNIDNHASQNLLSLLQKGKDMELSSGLDVDLTDKARSTEGATTHGNVLVDPGEANPNSLKQVTLEALFGSAFMKELQSVEGAAISVQRSSVGSAGADGSESIRSLSPASDNGLPPAGKHGLEKMHQPKTDRFEEQWLDYGDPHGDVNSSLHQTVRDLDGHNGIHLPEEDRLMEVGDPLQNFLSTGNSAKSNNFKDTPVDIAGKLAALRLAFRDEQPIIGNRDGLPYTRGPYDMREPGIAYQNLNVLQSSSHHPLQLNHMGSVFNHLDSHPSHIDSYMKLITPEGMVKPESPPNHQFPGNMHFPPFHQPSRGLNGFDPPGHHSMLQQMHMQGNFPPHLFQGFPRGAPVPTRPSNTMNGFMQEPNPMQGFPLSGHPHSTFGGPTMQLPASDASDGRNHPEALQRLFEMELRSRATPGFRSR